MSSQEQNRRQPLIIIRNPGETPAEREKIDHLATSYAVGADSAQVLNRWSFYRWLFRRGRISS